MTKARAKNSDDLSGSMSPTGAKRIVVALGAVLLFIFGVTWMSVVLIEGHIKWDLQKSLRMILLSSQSAINSSYDGYKETAEFWAKNPEVMQLTVNLLEMKGDEDKLIFSTSLIDIRYLFEPVLRISGFGGFFLIANDNTSIASTRDINIGNKNLLNKQGDFLERVRAGEVRMSLPQISDVPLMDSKGQMIEEMSTMFVAAPVNDKSGKVIAVLAFRLKPDRLISNILNQNHFGSSGETYAFDRNGVLVSESRFNDQLIENGLLEEGERSNLHIVIRDPGVDMTTVKRPLRPRGERPLTRMAVSATAGRSGIDIEGYRDYRGVQVIGAWTWDDSLDIGFASEVDTNEAFATLVEVKLIILAFSFVATAGFVLLGIIFFYWRKQMLSAKRELNIHRDHLEDLIVERTFEVKEKSQQLENALEQEKEYNYLQQKFVSLVSHEFRTPLAIIDGAAQRLIRRKNTLEPDEIERRVDKIRNAVLRMTRLIETTLDVSRLDAGEVRFNPTFCDIREIVKKVCERQDEISPLHNIHVSVEGLPEKMFIDNILIELILTNLLSNAVKYAPNSAFIEVKGEMINGQVFISVTDKGFGISEDDLPQIFKTFFRARTAEGISGTGIGLSISMDFAKMLGGTIDVVSVEGEGSTFTVQLPIVDRKL